MADLETELLTKVMDTDTLGYPSDDEEAASRMASAFLAATDLQQTQINAIDLTGKTNVEGAWDFDGDLTDRSGNGNSLSMTNGSPQFAVVDTKQALLLANEGSDAPAQATGYAEISTTPSELLITGDLTVHALVNINTKQIGGLNQEIVQQGAASAAPGSNALYNLYVDPDYNWTYRYFAENGAGPTAIFHSFFVLVLSGWRLITLVRESNEVTLYMNGHQVGPASSGLSAPSGGSATTFRVGRGVSGAYGDLVIQSEATDAAGVLAVARQVGVSN